ncbi:hypothetical protein [Lactococcus lactis]
MFKRKKFMALCATTLAGISALGSFAPMAAFADVAKNGDTVVTYEGAPKPAEWGLSVPSTVKFDKDAKTRYIDAPIKFGNLQVAIVDENGTSFKDSTKDHNFEIVPKGTNFDNKGVSTIKSADGSIGRIYYSLALKQGQAAPTDDMDYANSGNWATTTIETKADGSNVNPTVDYQIGIGANGLVSVSTQLTDTISWTATEKTS